MQPDKSSEAAALNVPVNVGDIERIGKSVLPRAALDYFRTGAGEEVTLRNNREAFRRLKIRPRFLRDVSQRNLTTTALGKHVTVPFGISPAAMQRMAHPDGEVATARAAEKMGTVFIMSTFSTSSIEEVAEAAPNGTKWLQFYLFQNRNTTMNLVARAEQSGFQALVLTVDTPVYGTHLTDAQSKFRQPHLKFANLTESVESNGGTRFQDFLLDQSLTWKIIGWLKSITRLPLIVKGILTREDAEEALKQGVAGILVSNHGARHIDGFPATIEALPEIFETVNGRCEVYLDGGVTLGTDVFKALALGAKMIETSQSLLSSSTLRRLAARSCGMPPDKRSEAGALNVPVNVGDIERIGKSVLPRAALDYFRTGAGEEVTLRNNREAFRRLKIRPRFLRDVSQRNLTTTALGKHVTVPFGISPAAMQRMAHPDGEVATARAAEKMGTVFIMSTFSTSSIEEVAEAAPNGTKWLQFYLFQNRNTTMNLVARAEQSGFQALVLTVDTPVYGTHLTDAQSKFRQPHLKFANLTESVESNGGTRFQDFLLDQSLTWKIIGWLKSITRLPLIVKGILTREDAEEALKQGVAGILVSNHGARHIDGFPATIEALPEIFETVNGHCEVYLDGGVTLGTDVFKALALGAKMVFFGRPAIWGLAYNGEDGVKSVLEFIRNEFDFTMALTGCASIQDIKPEMVVQSSYYCRL